MAPPTTVRLAQLNLGNPHAARGLPCLGIRFALNPGVTEREMLRAGWKSTNPPPPGMVYFEMARASASTTPPSQGSGREEFIELLVFDTIQARTHSLVRLERRPDLSEAIAALIAPNTTTIWMGELGDLPADFAPWGTVNGLDDDTEQEEDNAAAADDGDQLAASFSSNNNDENDNGPSAAMATADPTPSQLGESGRLAAVADALTANPSTSVEHLALLHRASDASASGGGTPAVAPASFDLGHLGPPSTTSPSDDNDDDDDASSVRSLAVNVSPTPLMLYDPMTTASTADPFHRGYWHDIHLYPGRWLGRAHPSSRVTIFTAVPRAFEPEPMHFVPRPLVAVARKNSGTATEPSAVAAAPARVLTFQHNPHAAVECQQTTAVADDELYRVARSMCAKFGWALDAPAPPPVASQHQQQQAIIAVTSAAPVTPVADEVDNHNHHADTPQPRAADQATSQGPRGPRRQTLCALVDFASGGRKRCFVDTMTIVGGQPPAVGDRVSVRMPRGGVRVGKVQTVASWSMRKASSLEGIGIVEGLAATSPVATQQQQPQLKQEQQQPRRGNKAGPCPGSGTTHAKGKNSKHGTNRTSGTVAPV